MKNTYKLIFLSLCLLPTPHVLANSEERLDHFLSLSLEELMALEVTISTDTKQSLTKAPAVVTVITQEDIKATGATNLVDVLEGVPGIHVRASHFASRPLVQFRGANATQTLLMVNGNSMRDLTWGFGIFWKGLPVSMIDRVEIIRGPGSALFGADASAGVINVITKTAGTIDKTEVGVRAGSFNTQSVWGQSGGEWNGYRIGMTAEVSRTDGHDPYIPTDAQTTQDLTYDPDVSYAPNEAEYGWRNHDFHFSVAKDNWRLQGDYVAHSDLEVGLTGAGVLDPNTQAEDSRYNLDLLYSNEAFSQNWGLDAELRYQHLDYSSGDGFFERPPGYQDATGAYPDGIINQMSAAEQRMTFEVSGLYKGLSGHAIRVGAGRTWQDLYRVEQYVNSGTGPDGNPIPAGSPLVDLSDSPYAFAPEKIRQINYLFVQDVWAVADDLELTAGMRYDDYSDFGSTVNPRLAVVWQNSERLTTKLMYGQAFRAPSYQELFAVTSRSLPNPNLEPERSETIELALAFAASQKLQLNLNLFHFTQSDLIQATGTPRQFQNTGDHTIRGVEIEALWQLSRKLRVSGNYTTREQDDSGFQSYDEPEQEAYLRADWSVYPKWNWNVQANWIGERERRSTDSRDTLEAHLVTDTTLRYVDSEHWIFAASVRNLFDEDAREYTGAAIADDLPLPERNFYLELGYKF